MIWRIKRYLKRTLPALNYDTKPKERVVIEFEGDGPLRFQLVFPIGIFPGIFHLI